MIVLPFYCNLHLIHTFHFHLKYDYSVLKHISPVPSNYRQMKITGSSRHQEGCWSPWLQGRQLAPPPGGPRGRTEEKWGLWRRGGEKQNGEERQEMSKVGDRTQGDGDRSGPFLNLMYYCMLVILAYCIFWGGGRNANVIKGFTLKVIMLLKNNWMQYTLTCSMHWSTHCPFFPSFLIYQEFSPQGKWCGLQLKVNN